MQGVTNMVSFRHFTTEDAPILQKEQYPNMNLDEIKSMIDDWNKNTFSGKYFEMFAITDNTKVVGTISLYEHSKHVASLGCEIFEQERHKGYAAGNIGHIRNIEGIIHVKGRCN